MLITHMHIPSGVSRVRLTAIVEAGELLVEFLGSSTVDLLALSFTLADL